MKPFNKNAKCPKCGSRGIRLKYHPPQTITGVTVPELMERSCADCEYMWVERTLDSMENIS